MKTLQDHIENATKGWLFESGHPNMDWDTYRSVIRNHLTETVNIEWTYDLKEYMVVRIIDYIVMNRLYPLSLPHVTLAINNTLESGSVQQYMMGVNYMRSIEANPELLKNETSQWIKENFPTDASMAAFEMIVHKELEGTLAFTGAHNRRLITYYAMIYLAKHRFKEITSNRVKSSVKAAIDRLYLSSTVQKQFVTNRAGLDNVDPEEFVPEFSKWFEKMSEQVIFENNKK